MTDLDKTRAILYKLATLDLSKYPYQEIKDLIGGIGSVGTILTTLHPGKIILRARPNYNDEHFSHVSEISYKPAQFNKMYQRASTPYNTMFYGSALSENIKPSELNIARVIGLFEAIPMMRDLTSCGEQVITYSRWRVAKDLPLISIVHYEEFQRDNSYAREQRENFGKFLTQHSEDVREKARLVTEFLASEYAKAFTSHDYDYLISAIYAEMTIVNSHVAGVFYPSVRTGGEGFNIAIHPTYLNEEYLVPEFVGECTIYKREKRTVIDNETAAIILAGQKEFVLKPVEQEFHIGRENVLRNLYPENYQ